MILATLSLLLAVFAASLIDTVTAQQCGSDMDQASVDAAESDFRQLLSTMKLTADATTTTSPPISIVWHVIQKGDDYYDGNVADSQIQNTVDDLNSRLGSSGISFTLTKITRTTNADWFSTVSPGDKTSEIAMKTELHEGGAATLNVYTVGFESGSDENLLGFSTYPWWYSSYPVNDGTVIHYSTLSGGTRRYFDEGKTLTHEVGHWLGLYHVFQGGCSGSGDQVHDTYAQSRPTDGCPWASKSCWFRKGFDNIHNFMDYSYDRCTHEFTDGQITRMKEQILAYRGIRVG